MSCSQEDHAMQSSVDSVGMLLIYFVWSVIVSLTGWYVTDLFRMVCYSLTDRLVCY